MKFYISLIKKIFDLEESSNKHKQDIYNIKLELSSIKSPPKYKKGDKSGDWICTNVDKTYNPLYNTSFSENYNLVYYYEMVNVKNGDKKTERETRLVL